MGWLPKAERIALAACHQTHTCKHCAAQFKPRHADYITFCSRECGYAWRRANAKGKTPGKCSDCGGVTSSPRSLRCNDCYRASVRVERHAPPLKQTTKRCADCGREVDYRKYVRRCEQCKSRRRSAARKASRRAHRHSPSRRADKAYRKALERGLVSGAERFDPIEVLTRDRWRCHICGVKTPKELRGSYDDRAPELDHVIPLAVGGQHNRANTACACRKCNLAKGAVTLGQLLLFG